MEDKIMKRLQVTAGHLNAASTSGSFQQEEVEDILENFFESAPVAGCCSSSYSFANSLESKEVDRETLKRWMDGPLTDVKDHVRKWLSCTKSSPELSVNYNLDELRDIIHGYVGEAVQNSCIHLTDLRDDPKKFFAFVSMTGLFNAAVTTKMAVQYGLWGGTIMNLGTERHQWMVPKIESVELPGCFLMTEIGHGSNVNGIETTAEYCPKTQEFIVNSPNFEATKYWIGNGAKFGLKATLFARLIFEGKDLGVHAFVMDIRDPKTMKPMPGVTIFDCGEKMGLQGVDNGAFFFENVRLPRESMLNRFSEITADNKYVCHFENPAKHFGAVIGELSAGRVLIGTGALVIGKLALAIAIRYGWVRKQFGPSFGHEVPIMFYPTHQMRLMPHLASLMVRDSFVEFVNERYANRSEKDASEVHALSSSLKAYNGWAMSKAIQECREACGGMGFRSKSRFGSLKADTDVFLTYEGDNVVLSQQITKYLVALHASQSGRGHFSGMLSYLSSPTKCSRLGASNCGASSAMDYWTCPKLKLALLEKREGLMLQKLMDKLAKLERSGVGKYDAWQSCLHTVSKIGEVNNHRLVYQYFLNDLEKAPASIKPVLELAGNIFALTCIGDNIGFYLANDCGVCKTMANELEEVRETLCHDFAQYSRDIVEAMDIPENMLPQEDLCEM